MADTPSKTANETARHTPGPWETSWAPDVTGYPTYTIHGFSGSDKYDAATHEANARLIAAAPDMADALKGLLRIIEGVRFTVGLSGTQIKRVAAAKAALAKAGG